MAERNGRIINQSNKASLQRHLADSWSWGLAGRQHAKRHGGAQRDGEKSGWLNSLFLARWVHASASRQSFLLNSAFYRTLLAAGEGSHLHQAGLHSRAGQTHAPPAWSHTGASSLPSVTGDWEPGAAIVWVSRVYDALNYRNHFFHFVWLHFLPVTPSFCAPLHVSLCASPCLWPPQYDLQNNF